jgi:hypothetical protein
MGWVYDDTGEAVPQHLQPKGTWVYDDTNQPVPHDLIPGDTPFQPGWRGQTMRQMVADIPPPTMRGVFDPPAPGELNPTAQRLEDWLRRKGAGAENALPGWVQPIVDPVLQPATPTEAAVTGVGGLGLGAQAAAALLGPEAVPPMRGITSAAQLATALAGGALQARPGHRIEGAENEALKTALGLLIAKALHIPYAPVQPIKAVARTFAPAVGRVGTPMAVTKGPEVAKSMVGRVLPAPTIIEGGGEGGGEGGEGGAP